MDWGLGVGGVQDYDNLNVSSTTSDNPHYYILFYNYLLEVPIIKLGLQHIRGIAPIVQAQEQKERGGVRIKY